MCTQHTIVHNVHNIHGVHSVNNFIILIGVSHFPTDGGVVQAKRNEKDMKSTLNFSPAHHRRKF